MEDQSSPSSHEERAMMADDNEIERKEVLSVAFNVSHEAKLRELLHKINSIEIKLCKDGTKEFIKLLKSDEGGGFLRMYVHMSSNLSDLLGAWKLHQGKPGVSYVLTLVSVVLGHPEGQYVPNDKERIVISRALDRFAQSVTEEKLDLVYKEINGKEVKCQKASLLLTASIVRRGSGLASEVAKNFNFKLQGFSKLAGYKKKKNDKDKHSTRKAFVGFAMSFLEVAKPRLLRWILQQREMYSGVLRGLGSDDEETVTYIICTLRDRVLRESSLVPPSLRSVLFGSHALEQLADISGRQDGGPVAELAHNLLILVCTDPSNGLMPCLIRYPNPLRGNPKRLLGLMMKLKATEISYHRDLLLAIVKGRPFFASAYMEEFPYNLEDYKSPTWFAIVSLAASLVSSVGMDGLCFRFLDSHCDGLPSFDSVEVQSIMSCISPRRFRRAAINKGLLNEDFLVKNGTLRLFLEQLKLLDLFFRAINLACCRKERIEKLESLKLEIQNIIQTTIPDPQVLLTQLPSLSRKTLSDRSNLKRAADERSVSENSSKRRKRLQEDAASEDTDIIVGGITSSPDNPLHGVDGNDVDTEMPDKLDNWKEYIYLLANLWGSDISSVSFMSLEDCETFFHCKLIDGLKIYKLTLPTTLEGSFDFFMNLLTGPATLKTDMQVSLLSLLVEYIKWSPTSEIAVRTPPLMYKHLQSFISLIFSPVGAINVQAYNLARAAMSSANIFDRNINEVSAWLLFLPGSIPHKSITGDHEREMHQCLSSAVISFFCDAVSTVGNSLYKYWGVLRDHTCKIEEFQDVVPNFSPLVICVLQKCRRLLISESNTFSLPQKSMVSLYVCNTLKYLLQTQDHMGLLSALVRLVLSEELQSHSTKIGETTKVKCEWRPLKNLLLFAESILSQTIFCPSSESQKFIQADGSFTRTLGEVSKLIESGDSKEAAGLGEAFCSSILCTTTDELVKNFGMVINISVHLQVPFSFLSSIVFAEQNFLSGIWKFWPGMFLSGLEKAVSEFDTQGPFFEDITPSMNFDISESAAATAFSLFLMQTPFHMLLNAMMSIDTPLLKESSKVKSFFLAKLSACKSDCAISYLQLVLFWLYQIQSSNRINPSAELEQLAEICTVLIKHILAQLLIFESESDDPTKSGVSLSMPNTEDIVGIILSHPLVQSSLKCLLKDDEAIVDGDFGKSLDLEALHNFSESRVCRIDCCVFSILTTAIDYLLSPSGGQARRIDANHSRQLHKDLTTHIERLFTDFREKFDLEVQNENSLPLLLSYYLLQTFIRIISPFQILDLVHWIFNRLNISGTTGGISQKSHGVSGLTVGLSVACDAFEVLSSYLQDPTIKSMPFYAVWAMEEKNFDANIIEVIYSKLCEFASNYDLDLAYVCLTKALGVSFRQKCKHHSVLNPLSLVLSRAIVNTPLKILLKCISKPSIAKGKSLFLLVEMSPLHLSVFGHIISGLVDKGIHFKSKTVEETYVSDDEYMVLLPAVMLYLNSFSMLLEKHHYCQFKSIPAFYSRILLRGFYNWKSFVSGDIFQENYEFLPSYLEEFVNLVGNSLLGKAIRMLQHHSVLRGEMKTKDRLKLFNSLITSSAADDVLLDCDLETAEGQSINQSLNHINKVVAKLSLCQFILFKKDKQISDDLGKADGNLKEVYMEKVSGKEGRSRMLFIKFLVNTWQCLVKKLPLESKGSVQLYRYLELFILRTVAELLMEMRDGLVHLQSIPFVECMMKSSLLYRFEDPKTLKFLCHILILLADGKLPYGLFLQLLLGHSQFGETFHITAKIPSAETGPIFRPISGILKSVVMPYKSNKNEVQTADHVKQLGILRLVRVLLHLSSQQRNFDAKKDINVNLKELHSLLLTSYGATLHEIDLEKYAIMREIESIDESVSRDVAEVDYLWGTAALKIRKEDAEGTSNVVIDKEDAEEQRKIQFKENLPVDPNMCVRTVLLFPFDRTAIDEPSSFNRLKSDDAEDVFKIDALCSENLLLYDPVYILHFSIHALSIEPVDFAALGLLAIAFISLSSPDIGVRKLGYESLGRCKNALESYKRKKEVMRLRLLLAYIQNGIEEPWQRVPAVVALFAAESSFILLDPSNDHYTTLSKHLSHSSRVNLKSIPLFHTFFSSSYSKTERLWILRLAYAGLNLDNDAHIYMRNSVIETFLGYYSSPLSDNDLKELILQVVKKAIKLHKLARYLVEQCGILPWLSSLLSTFSRAEADNDRHFCSRQIITIIEVVTEVVESRNIVEWLQSHALEQLMELTTQLYKLYVGSFKWLKEEATFSNMALRIIMLTKKMSQKRKMYQPHFTLSFEGLLNIYKASESYSISRSIPHTELALQTILMSTPKPDIFCKDLGMLSNFLMWAASTAMKSDLRSKSHENQGLGSVIANSEGKQNEESLTSKLLRWLVSSVILGKMSCANNKSSLISSKRANLNSLQSFLEYIERGCLENRKCRFDCDEMLAGTIFYLQQVLGMNFKLLPSVVSALSLFLLGDSSKYSEFIDKYGAPLPSLLSKIRCPPEANPAWRWSFFQPWKDLTSEMSDSEELDEYHACQSLLVVISNIIGSKSRNSQFLSYQDLVNTGLFERDCSMLDTSS